MCNFIITIRWLKMKKNIINYQINRTKKIPFYEVKKKKNA